MIGILFVLAVGWPQAPDLDGRTPTAELLRAVCEDVGAGDGVAEIVRGLRPRLRRAEAPALAVELRLAGLGAPDAARAAFDPLAREDAPWHAVLGVIARAHGDRRTAEGTRGPVDLDVFERTISHVHRDLIQALGGQQDPDRAFSHWGGIADRLQRHGFDSMPDHEAVEDALDSRRGMDMAELRLLAGRVLHVAAALDVEELRASLRGTEARAARSDGAVQGEVFLDRDGPFGRLVVGGFGPNSYDCTQIDVLVDLGGADEYRGPAGAAGGLRRLGVVVDLEGDDVYRGGLDAVGSATWGIGVLLDRAGDDRYEVSGRGLGFGVAGVGCLVDLAGDDRYVADGVGGGVGCHGTGVLADLEGNDRYEVNGSGLGVGLPGGFGLFWDRTGDDVAACAASEVAFGALGAGMGSGIREDGGLGVALDAAGDDQFAGPGESLGVGVDGGVGFLWDVGGSDAATCGRRSMGFGARHGLGVHVDEAGDDRRAAGPMGLGFGASGGMGIAIDLAGQDQTSSVHPSLGDAETGGLGIHADWGGADHYASRRVDPVEARPVPEGSGDGTAVGVLFDLGAGPDTYAFDRIPGLTDGQERRLGGGRTEGWVRHLVDRER
ncbi:MAG: hypothetical protein ACO3RU_01980 [Planctomycetota bacterium]